MEFEKLIRKRRSVRAYEKRSVEPEKVRAVLEAADIAPTAGNLQAFEVVRVTDPTVKRELARAALGQNFIAEAPVTLVFFANPARSARIYGRRGTDLYCIQDASIACAFAHLRAADLGLGSVWVGAFNDDAVSRAVKAPPDLHPIAILPIGYPAESPAATSRRGVGDFLREETF